MRNYCGVVAALALIAFCFAPASFAQTGRVILGPASSPQTSAHPGVQSLPAFDGTICGPHPRGWDDGRALIQEADLSLKQLREPRRTLSAQNIPLPRRWANLKYRR